MADAKPAPKPPVKPAAPTPHPLFALEIKILEVLVALGVIGFLLYLNLGFFFSDRETAGIVENIKRMWRVTVDVTHDVYDIVAALAIFIALMFILGIIYFNFRRKEAVAYYRATLPKGYIASTAYTEEERTALDVKDEVIGGFNVEGENTDNRTRLQKFDAMKNGGNERWQEIEKHMATNSVSEWKVAILEADIILYEMLDQMGYEGITVADKLRQASPINFTTLDYAWRAHKIRNIVAHEGATYEISREEAMNTINLYRKVFEEFYFI